MYRANVEANVKELMTELPLDEIIPGMRLGQDIYSENNVNMPLMRKGNIVKADYIQKL